MIVIGADTHKRTHALAAVDADTGPLTAAILIGQTAGAERFASDAHFARMVGVAPIPASSGRRDRHRLHRGGNRQLNRALHVIAITRGRIDPQTRAYLARKESEGKTRIEAMRCLKRTSLGTFTASSPRHRLAPTPQGHPVDGMGRCVKSIPDAGSRPVGRNLLGVLIEQCTNEEMA
jgi:transposase